MTLAVKRETALGADSACLAAWLSYAVLLRGAFLFKRSVERWTRHPRGGVEIYPSEHYLINHLGDCPDLCVIVCYGGSRKTVYGITILAW